MKYLKIFEGFWSDRKKRRKIDATLSKFELEINNTLSNFIGKKYGFQYKVIIWKSKNSNYEEIDHDILTFNGIEVERTYSFDSDLLNGIFFYLKFIDKHDDDVLIYFTEKSITSNVIDLEYAKPWDIVDKSLMGSIPSKEEDDVDYEDESRYPNRSNSITYVPSEYKTIEMLEELKRLLISINENILDT